MATHVWEVDVNGFVGTLAVTLGAQPEKSSQCSGYLELDTGHHEDLTDVYLSDSVLHFIRPSTGQDFTGILHEDRIIGTFTHWGLVYPWSARPGVSNRGMADIGDINGDGQADGRDVADYLRSLGLRFLTYRACDDVYNPGGFNLLAHPAPGLDMNDDQWTWRPDGLPKVIDENRFDEYAVAPAPYPVENVPALRHLANVLLTVPRHVLDPLLGGQNWKVDFSGIFGQDTITAEWLVDVNGYRGRVLIASMQAGSGRVCFDGIGQWEPVYGVKLTATGYVEFRRVLPDGVEQEYIGLVYPAGAGGQSKIEGSFSQAGTSYAWAGTGTWCGSGEGISDFDISANGHHAHLKLRLPSGWIGRMILHPTPNQDLDPWNPKYRERWEPLSQIDFKNQTLTFYRPGAEQSYTGTVNGDRIDGTFTAYGQTYKWGGDRAYATGGTTAGGYGHTPGQEIGQVGHTMYLGVFSSPGELIHELVGHPLAYLIRAGGGPFSDEDRQAFKDAMFQGPVPPGSAGRPVGFVDSYAALGDEDFAQTLMYYVTNRAALCAFASEDSHNNSPSTVLLGKLDFIQRRVFHDAYMPGPWQIDANGYPGMLYFGFSQGSAPPYHGRVRFDDVGQEETLDNIDYNGVNVRFDRHLPGGVDQHFVGRLKGFKLEGFFTQGGQSYPWNAVSIVQW